MKGLHKRLSNLENAQLNLSIGVDESDKQLAEMLDRIGQRTERIVDLEKASPAEIAALIWKGNASEPVTEKAHSLARQVGPVGKLFKGLLEASYAS